MWAGSVTTWVKTDPTALTTNDVVVIVDQTSGKAMEANGTSAPKATEVTLKSDKSEISSGVIAAMQFKVTIGTTKVNNVDTRSYQFGYGTDYLYCTASNNGVRIGTNDDNVFIIKKADANSEEDFIFNTTQSRYLGVYNNQDWRCYTTVNNNIKGTVTAFYKKVVVESADAPDAPTFSPVAGTYYTGQYVEISCTTEGATIKKSYDGEHFETNNEACPVMEDKTIWAYAEKNGEQSEIVSASYIIGSTYDSFAPMQEAAAAEGFSNKAIQYRATGGMVVAYVNGKNAYLIDGSGNGILAYNKDGLGELAAGQKMNYDDGYLTATLENYQGNAELTGIVFPEMTGGTVTVTPVEKTLPLTSANQSTLVTLKGLTYNADAKTLSDGTNTITFFDKFKTKVTLVDEKTYDVTGIVVMYNTTNNSTIEICPRTAADVVEATPAPIYILGDMANWDRTNPTAMAWDSVNEVYTYTFTSTAAATYFCFADGTQTAEEAAADNEWTTFNSTYRWAIAEGDQEYNLNWLDTPEQLQKTNGTIILPAGEWTISVTADMIMTITGEATPVENKYYIIGNMTNWNVDENYKMTAVDGADTEEYQFTMDLTTSSEFKVVKVEGETKTWYPDGSDNNYGQNGEISADGNYTIYFRPKYDGGEDWFYNVIYVSKNEEPVVGFRDIKVTLNDADMWQNKINSSGAASTVYITVDAEGNIGTTENADEAAATLKGYWHGAQYGWQKFSAEVPVEGCVKITLGASNFGSGAVIVTNSENEQVAKIDNHTGAMWSTSNPGNIAVGYYRRNVPTTLTFSECDYIPYFAVEAIDEADLPAEVTNYNVTFAAGEGVEGVAPAALEVEAGNKITAPANYTLYKEGSTLTGWSDGETTYAPGEEITPTADMQLTAVFTENTVNLADRTETVSISWALGQKSGDEGVEYNGKKGVVVTRAAVNNKRIDAKLDVDATNGKFNNKRNDDLAQINANTKLTIPACKGAIITVKAYATGYNLTIDGTAMTDNEDNTYTYTVADEKESIDIVATAQVYLSFVNVTLPVVDGSNLLYTWESPTGNPVETGGTIAYVNGDGNRLNYQNSGYYTICLNGKKANINDATASANAGKMVITLDKALHAGDKINMTAYITNSSSKTASAYVLFGTGTSIDGDDYSDAANIGLATPGKPTTTTITVPEAADGSKTITLTRSKTGTNLFITKLVITTEVEDNPNAVETPVITPATGTYTTEQEVTITCETEDAKIYYTTDGTDPTAESTAYTAAFTVSETTTVKAIAIKGEYSSEIAESVITITTVQPGTSNLEWNYTEAAPTANPDPDANENLLYYGAAVNDAAGTNNGLKGVKLNGGGYAFFAKNPVEGKLTLTFGPRKNGSSAYAVNVYACTITDGETPTATKGNLIGEIAVEDAPGTGSLDIPATVTGIYIERKSTSEGVLQMIVFKEKVARTFVDFEITNDQLKGAIADMNLPEGVSLTGTQPEAGNNSHGYSNATITVPTDGGAVKFTIGGCQYANPATFDVKNSNSDVVATIDEKTSNCYHQTDKDISTRTITYIYTGEATTLTFGPMAYLPYFKAEAVEVQEVTVTYKDQNGTALGEKKVIEGDAIGESPYSEADLTIADNEKFRGWTYTSGIKVKTTDVVTSNTTVLASVTPIEAEPTVGSVQTYDLTNNIFYPEDHENFDVTNGSYYNNHGFDFAAGGSFSVKVAGKAQIVLTLCEYGSGTTITVTDANSQTIASDVRAKAESGKDGDTETLNYDGEATTLTFTFATQTYLHKVTVYNVENFIEKDEATGWYIVPAGDGASLVLALNAAASEPNSKIFLPNGTYDLGQATMTPISGNNISIIGESMDGVVIKNRPIKEGLDVAATFLNTGTGLYMQDLTIDCIAPWSGTAERGVTLRDNGNQTILKNVYLKGRQDTYYSNNPSGTFYFEDGKVEGSVDYVCGNGDVYFNKTSFYTVNKSTGGKGGCIAAPNTTTTDKKFGYIFNKCTLDGVENEDGQYRLGRPWADNTQCLYLNTTMNIQPRTEGWGEWSDDVSKQHSVTRYAEYNSMDADGNAISLTGRKTSFKGVANNPVLTEDEAAAYTPEAIFNGDWRPQVIATQVTAPKAELKDGVITWTPANDGATAYAIFKDGNFLGITIENSWTVEEAAGAPRRTGEESQTTGYTIRAANSRGGFGLEAEVSPATGISAIETELGGDMKIYDLNGRRVMTPTKGVYIINGKKVVIK